MAEISDNIIVVVVIIIIIITVMVDISTNLDPVVDCRRLLDQPQENA